MIIPGKKTEKIVDEKAVEKFIGKGKITEKPTTNPEVRTITLKVDQALLERIDKAANRLGIPRSSFIKSAISAVLENGLTVKLD